MAVRYHSVAEIFYDERTGDKLSLEIDMGDELLTAGTYAQRCFLFLLERIVRASPPRNQPSKSRVLRFKLRDLADTCLIPSEERALAELNRMQSPFCPKIQMRVDGPWSGAEKPEDCDSLLLNCIHGIEPYGEDGVKVYYDARFPWFLIYALIKGRE